jgi:Nif-specific regulatory protein
MGAELVVLTGELSGNRYLLESGELEIGRAPSGAVCLNEPDAAWRHCVVRRDNGRYRLDDLKSGRGTYVNGLRINQHWLEDGDQISIGETVLLFRAVDAPSESDSVRSTMLRASTLLFLVRALAASQGQSQQQVLERQLIRLVGDLLPCEGGAFLIGRGASELKALARERSDELARVVSRVCTEGPIADPLDRIVAVPIYVRDELGGALVIELPEVVTGDLLDLSDLMSAVATLASAALESVREVESLRTANALLQEKFEEHAGIVGSSPPMQTLLKMVDRVGPQDTTVLILGESGTGKELVARALHLRSPRREKPFVAINCAALTETLLESELFGHEKGAFTGAVAQKKGKLELAEGGTVFLDEIGELAPTLQAKLLRVLQQREFDRVGGTKTLRLNVRLIAATNRDLAAEARKGAFREDLFHRLNVVALRTPALRERREDIPDLAYFFLQRAAGRYERKVTGLSPEAERCLVQYGWPGNVRELENAIERAVVLGDTELIMPEDLPEAVLAVCPADSPAGAFQMNVSDAKKDSIQRAWTQAGGDYKAAAKLLGVHPNSLLRLIRNLGLRDVLKA